MKAKKYPSPQLFTPTREDSLRVLKEVSKGFSDDKVLTSSTYSDLKERGNKQIREINKQVETSHNLGHKGKKG